MVNNFVSKEEAVKIVQQKRNKTRRRLISVLEFIFANILQVNYPSPKGKGLVKAQID